MKVAENLPTLPFWTLTCLRAWFQLTMYEGSLEARWEAWWKTMKARKAATDKMLKRALDKNANVSMNPPITTMTPHLSKDKDAMP